MIVFAFPGTGKTTLSRLYPQRVVELEISEIKYDNRNVAHLSKEERKGIRRPISHRTYKATYVHQALSLHAEGKLVLVALNLIWPVLRGLWRLKDVTYHVYLPELDLREEYRQRYLCRGNNAKFIREVMWVWRPTILLFKCLSKIWPQTISFLKAGEHLAGCALVQDMLSQSKIRPFTKD